MERILKLDGARRRVYGIALIADEADSQGDVVSDADLEDAGAKAVLNGCAVRIDHEGEAVGRLCASWPLTAEIAAALGIERPGGKSAWLVGLQVENDAVWDKVRTGDIGHALSVGGRGEREEITT